VAQVLIGLWIHCIQSRREVGSVLQATWKFLAEWSHGGHARAIPGEVLREVPISAYSVPLRSMT
jgi:hypothetical protein